MFTFSFKFLQTSFRINELIKHESKFNRKVFHNRENSRNRFSGFSFFMKGFKKYLIREKKNGEKWLNYLQVTKFFPDFLFPDQYFSSIFSPDKEFITIFFSIIIIIIIIFSYLFLKFIITMFFSCALFIVVEQSSFNKNFEMRVKVRNWKK